MYSKHISGSTEVTSSHLDVNNGTPSIVTQGYNRWGERNNRADNLNRELSGLEAYSASVDAYPILSTIPNDVTMSLYRQDVPYFWSTYNRKDAPTGQTSNQPQIDNLIVSSKGGGDSVEYDVFQYYDQGSFGAVTFSDIDAIDFTNNFASTEEIYLSARDSSDTEFGRRVTLKLDNCTKYSAVRIAFKNRYGAFDQFDFPLVSRSTFNAATKQFKTPSISSTLPRYDDFRYSETYYSEGGETITVNTDFVDERLNEFFKGLLISDEIYIVEPSADASGINATLTPLTISSTSTQLKTKEVDKLIQYQFTFNVATPHKLVL